MTELILPLFILQRVLAARVDNPCWGETIIFSQTTKTTKNNLYDYGIYYFSDNDPEDGSVG